MVNILVIVAVASLVLWIAKRERLRLDLIRILRERTGDVEKRLAQCTVAIHEKEAEIAALEGGINEVGVDIRRNQETIGRVQSHLQTLRRLPRATLRSFDKVHNPLVPLWVADVSTIRGGEVHRQRYLIATADERDAENVVRNRLHGQQPTVHSVRALVEEMADLRRVRKAILAEAGFTEEAA